MLVDTEMPVIKLYVNCTVSNNLKFIGDKWAVYITYSPLTCQIDVPFNTSQNLNVLMQFNSDSFCSCSIAAADLAKKNYEARYLFWSPDVNSAGKNEIANCYVFKSCAEKELNSIIYPGTTYKFCQNHSESKYCEPNMLVDL